MDPGFDRRQGSLRRPYSYIVERLRCKAGSIGFIFGLMGFIFALSALGKIHRLEPRLKDAWVLKKMNDSG
jgi:hypothetical protein